MTAPAVYGVGTVGQNAGSGNPTAPGIPSGTLANHLLLSFVVSSDNVASTVAGFTNEPTLTGNNGTLQRFGVYYKWAVGGDTAPTVTHTAGNGCSAVILGVTGMPIASGSPFATLGTPSLNASSLTVTATGITPATAYDLVFWFGAASIAGTSSSNNYTVVGGTDPTFTERADSPNFQGSNEIDFAVDTGPTLSGSATGTRTSTLSALAMPNMGVMFSLTGIPPAIPDADRRLFPKLTLGGLS